MNGKAVRALLDKGCHYPVVVHSKFVRDEDRTDEQVDVVYANGSKETLPITYVKVDCPYVRGPYKAACVPRSNHDLVLGCEYVLPQPNPATCREVTVGVVETRAAKSTRATTGIASDYGANHQYTAG